MTTPRRDRTVRILFATQTRMYLNQGDVVHVSELCQELVELGCSVTLIASGESNHALPGVRYINAGQVRPGPRWVRIITYLVQTARGLFHVLAHARGADVLYTRDARLGLCLWLLQPVLGLPLVFEVNGLRGAEKSMEHTRPQARFVDRALTRAERTVARRSQKVVCVTTGLLELLHERYGVARDRMQVIPNGVNLEIFRPARDNAPGRILRERFRLRPEDYIIVFVGSLKPWIDFDTLLTALDLLELDDGEPVLIIVGDGPERASIEKRVAGLRYPQRCLLTGQVPYGEVPSLIQAADTCAMSFTTERNNEIGLSPLKLYAYLACGKPVVSTACRGLEFVADNNLGSLVAPRDSHAFAAELKRWRQPPPEPEPLSGRLRRYAEEHSGWEQTARDVMHVCLSVIPTRNSTGEVDRP